MSISAARTVLARIRGFRALPPLPQRARAAVAADRRGLPDAAPDPDTIIDECVAWLARAQDASTSADGGVARHYSLISGWAPSYPETTGYIVPTLLVYAERKGRRDVAERARRMLDWLVGIQFPEGAFQGSVIGASPLAPVVFNTGQILMGLAAGERALGGFRNALRRAADWLVSVQDADGCWRKHSSPFARPGEKTYDMHVAWGLIEAARSVPDAGYGEAAIANVRWALAQQHRNGWFPNCCLSNSSEPLTHTLGYALRGVIEAHLFTGEKRLLEAAQLAAGGLMTALKPDGWLPGRLDAEWQGTVDWVCITGSSQIAHCWLQLYRITGDPRYSAAAMRVNAWVRRTIAIDGPPESRGGVKGSFPVDGGYGAFEFLNWACKFTIDAQLLEQELATDRLSNAGTSSGRAAQPPR